MRRPLTLLLATAAAVATATTTAGAYGDPPRAKARVVEIDCVAYTSSVDVKLSARANFSDAVFAWDFDMDGHLDTPFSADPNTDGLYAEASHGQAQVRTKNRAGSVATDAVAFDTPNC